MEEPWLEARQGLNPDERGENEVTIVMTSVACYGLKNDRQQINGRFSDRIV